MNSVREGQYISGKNCLGMTDTLT